MCKMIVKIIIEKKIKNKNIKLIYLYDKKKN